MFTAFDLLKKHNITQKNKKMGGLSQQLAIRYRQQFGEKPVRKIREELYDSKHGEREVNHYPDSWMPTAEKILMTWCRNSGIEIDIEK